MPVVTQVTAINLQDVVEFAWYEADLLDHAEYDAWLALWIEDGRYVVPIDPGVTDFEATLNYAYDNQMMRQKRVDRLRNGMSISASPVARTVRSQSRFRLLAASAERAEVRFAQILTEFRRGVERTYTADVELAVVRGPEGLRLEQKVIRLVNSTAPLRGIGYIL